MTDSDSNSVSVKSDVWQREKEGLVSGRQQNESNECHTALST